MSTRILLTGGSGFVGTHLRFRLAAQMAQVAILNRRSIFNIQPNEFFYPCDLLNGNSVSRIFDSFRPEYVIHLADSKERGSSSPAYHAESSPTLISTKNMIEASLRLSGLIRFVSIGTCDEYGVSQLPFQEVNVEAPISNYGKAKLAATKALLASHKSRGLPVTILRPSIIYGPNQGDEMFLPALINSLMAGREFPMTPGEQYRDFLFVDDVVNAISSTFLGGSGVNGAIINIASGHSDQIKSLAISVSKLISPQARNLIKLGALPYRENEVMNYSVDINRAKSLINWEPRTSLIEGLALTIRNKIST